MHGFSVHMAAGYFGHILWTASAFFIKKYLGTLGDYLK